MYQWTLCEARLLEGGFGEVVAPQLSARKKSPTHKQRRNTSVLRGEATILLDGNQFTN